MRGFGKIIERSRGGLSGFYAEQRVCDAKRAIRFQGLAPVTLSGFYFPVRCQPRMQRKHFFFDGRATGKFEIGFEFRKGWQVESALRSSLAKVAEHLLTQQVQVGDSTIVTLQHAGPRLAHFYERASTWRGQSSAAIAALTCRSAEPLVTLSLAATSTDVVVPPAARSCVIGDCRLVSWRTPHDQTPYSVVAIIERGRRNTDLARNLRLFVTRVHAELVSIELALQTLVQQLSKSPDDEVAELLKRIADPIADKITRLEGLVTRIGKSARALAAAASDSPGSLGEAVLYELWPGRLDLVRDRFDVVLRQATRRSGDLAYKRSIWPFKFKRDPRIFISYRRADTGSLAEELEAHLQSLLPQGHVFRDAASILSGNEWRLEVLSAISRADIVVVLLGQDWAGLKTSLGRRIDDADDVFRGEIEMAITHGKRVVPVVAPGASMPIAGDFPLSLKTLTEYQSFQLTRGSVADFAAALIG